MKIRTILAKRDAPELGWLTADTDYPYRFISFFPGRAKPVLEGDGIWSKPDAEYPCLIEYWTLREWRSEYGNAPLPARGKAELVRLDVS